MKINSITPHIVVEKFRSIVNRKYKQERKACRFGTEVLMYSSEINLVEIIGANEGKSLTEVAIIVGLTKGAISQTLKKLVTKGLVEKKTDPENNSRILIYLTQKGKRVLNNHEKWHQSIEGDFRAYLFQLDKEKLIFLNDFFTKYEQFLKEREKK